MSGLKGGIASVILFCNILVVFSAMMPFALVKLLVPLPFVRRTMDRVLNALAQSWIAINGWWIALMQRVTWRVTGLEPLRDKDWYLVSSNHQTWVDILVLQKVFAGRIPFLKFFLKRELMYVPFMGLAWWALDFPFMRRSGGGRSFAKDLAATRKSCERFRMIPTSVINFLEGTRLTAAKHAAQNSPYRHLLKPKVGGLAMALAVMGDRFNSYLDVTIVYPKGVPRFWDLLCGRMEEVVVRVCEVKIPQALVTGSYDADADYRRQLQDWIQQMWVEKDGYIAEVLANTPNRSPAIS
ncbi:MAG: hypothetical protein QG616_18 [Pseudomonadota bacterium]|nr:hypothetical protein [Pseudomonadota bacterium]MDQ5904362.1 hypothetical protein [Pseudomonadota bacterium]MDQ5906408.1 hypothetical protein [Pseudomonadota bacterium]MDQ5946676.1 hypothetical protein [Pseudomonadota bacterium]